jgi:sugar/nucleoside kinase (ribokinase family)
MPFIGGGKIFIPDQLRQFMKPDAIVAGHLCLDIIPDLSAHAAGEFDSAFQPGRLIRVGAARTTTGGAVSNTGLALHRLGIPTRLLARVGADQLGQIIKQLVSDQSPELAAGLIASADSTTSYSIVISPPGNDRRFLHHPGANDDFCADDVCDDDIHDARLFHFGYPPLMARIFENDGAQLTEVFRRVKSLGLTSSLDMALPDPNSAAGRVDWRTILKNTLPYVDVFLPSLDEILFMLGRNIDTPLSGQLLNEVSSELLAMGAKMVVLKLGNRGLYLRVAAVEALQNMGRACPSHLKDWGNYENWLPCFQVDVVGTTGSGDATIAGFLAALLRGMSPTEAMNAALGVGACNVEAADALSGIRSWEDTLQRIDAGWARRG